MLGKTEKDYQNYFIKNLQYWGIDIFRNSNASSKGFTNVHSTTAFQNKISDTAFFKRTKKDKFACNKFFPDLIFPCLGRVWAVEFGFKESGTVRHKERKEMQAVRLKHWEENGGVYGNLITSFEDAEYILKIISRNIQKPIKYDYDLKNA